MRTCTRCGVQGTRTEKRHGKTTETSQCKACFEKYQRQYRANNKDRISAKKRETYRKDPAGSLLRRRLRELDLSHDEYLRLLRNACAICKSDKPGGKGSWHFDHDHKTGKVRGLLCHFCNTGLGLFRDNVFTLMAAVEYLKTAADDPYLDMKQDDPMRSFLGV